MGMWGWGRGMWGWGWGMWVEDPIGVVVRGLWGPALRWAPTAIRCRLQKTFTPNIISRKIKEE